MKTNRWLSFAKEVWQGLGEHDKVMAPSSAPLCGFDGELITLFYDLSDRGVHDRGVQQSIQEYLVWGLQDCE